MKRCLAVVLIISICVSLVACGRASVNEPQQEEGFQTLVTEPDKAENGILVYKNGYPGVYSVITDEKTVQFLLDSFSKYEEWEAVPENEQRSSQADFYFDCRNGLAFSLDYDENIGRVPEDYDGLSRLYSNYSCVGERIEQNSSDCTLVNADAATYYFPDEIELIVAIYVVGQLERKRLENAGTGTPVIEAKHFKIYYNELAYLAEQNSWYNQDNPSEIAEKQRIERHALFYRAKKEGFEPSDSELEAEIQRQIDLYSDFSDNESASGSGNNGFAAFLAGMGMTNEEYWHLMKEEMRMLTTIGAWEKHLREEYSQEHRSEEDWDWDTYYEDLKKSIIDAEDAHHVD